MSMTRCPHCDKDTFFGSGTCNHCQKEFSITNLEALFMKTEAMWSVGSRIVPGDNGSAMVVMRLVAKGKQGKPDQHSITITEFRRSGDGWKAWTGWNQPLALVEQIAAAIREVAP